MKEWMDGWIEGLLETPRNALLQGLRRCESGCSRHRETPHNNSKDTFEFTKENKSKIIQILSQYPVQYKKAAVLPLLHLAQDQSDSQWLPISALNHVADLLEMPRMRVYEVATFYTMFNREPVGKHHIQVCTTTPCQLCGAEDVLNAIKEHLKIEVGETSKDGKFTLSEVECAGACVNAPVEDLTKDSIVDVLKMIEDGKQDELTPGPQSSTRKSCEPPEIRPASLMGDGFESKNEQPPYSVIEEL